MQFIQILDLPANVPKLEGIMQDLAQKEVLVFKSAAYSEALLTMTAQERRTSYFCDRALVVGEDASSTSQVPRMAVFPEDGAIKVAVNVCYMCADILSMCKIMESRVESTTVVLYGATDMFMKAYQLKNLKQKTLESWSMLAGWKKTSMTETEEDAMIRAIQQIEDAEGQDVFQEMRDAKEDG